MPIQKIDIAEAAAALTEPYSLRELLYVGDLVVRVAICQGAMAWHKHMDADELFFAIEGEILLESEWGNNILTSGEIAVIPKGVGHRSNSIRRSVLLQYQRTVMPDRTNGQRRTFAEAEEEKVEKVNIPARAGELSQAFSPSDIARVDSGLVQVFLSEGVEEWHTSQEHHRALLVWEGEAILESEMGGLSLGSREMALIPRGVSHRLDSEDRAVVVVFSQDGGKG